MAEDHGERPRSEQMGLPHLGELPAFNRIGPDEYAAVARAMRKPLSGYLGGIHTGGYFVEKLQEDFRTLFKVKHAIACNSGTSGLLAACMAVGIGPGDTVWTSAYTMSATAACAKVLGATIVCIDVERMRFAIDTSLLRGSTPKAIIVTNLFGHPAYLQTMRSWCDSNKVWMIEDNAQSPLAMENGKYAGTVGHIGVFSFNIHKHIQCGEGGVVVTSDEALHHAIADSINHGELNGGHVGLNLRMTEPTAAIAVTQLSRAKQIINNRIEFANELTDMFSGVPWIRPPVQDIGCKHVFYCWAGLVANGKRAALVEYLNIMGFPMRAGYSKPLHIIFNSGVGCEFRTINGVVNHLEQYNLMTFEVCRYEPNWRQRKLMHEIAKRAIGEVDDANQRPRDLDQGDAVHNSGDFGQSLRASR